VTVGSRVRVLGLPASWERTLPADEWADVQTMVGEVFAVDEIDEFGQAWVGKSWDDGDGTSRAHSIGLEPHEMEWVGPPDAPQGGAR
jgi:hypothetical protein